MDQQDCAYPTIPEALYAKAIGELVLEFLKSGGLQKSAQRADTEATILLERVRSVLNDRTLDDPDCFQRIDEIVDAFDKAGIYTSRHDW